MAPLKIPTFILPRIIFMVFCAGLAVLALWYLSFQARFLIAGPELVMLEEPGVVQSSRVVQLKGAARNTTALYLNGRPIVTNEAGEFTEAIVLDDGYTVIRIEAMDRYGRTTKLERPLVYQEPLTDAT